MIDGFFRKCMTIGLIIMMLITTLISPITQLAEWASNLVTDTVDFFGDIRDWWNDERHNNDAEDIQEDVDGAFADAKTEAFDTYVLEAANANDISVTTDAFNSAVAEGDDTMKIEDLGRDGYIIEATFTPNNADDAGTAYLAYAHAVTSTLAHYLDEDDSEYQSKYAELDCDSVLNYSEDTVEELSDEELEEAMKTGGGEGLKIQRKKDKLSRKRACKIMMYQQIDYDEIAKRISFNVTGDWSNATVEDVVIEAEEEEISLPFSYDDSDGSTPTYEYAMTNVVAEDLAEAEASENYTAYGAANAKIFKGSYDADGNIVTSPKTMWFITIGTKGGSYTIKKLSGITITIIPEYTLYKEEEIQETIEQRQAEMDKAEADASDDTVSSGTARTSDEAKLEKEKNLTSAVETNEVITSSNEAAAITEVDVTIESALTNTIDGSNSSKTDSTDDSETSASSSSKYKITKDANGNYTVNGDPNLVIANKSHKLASGYEPSDLTETSGCTGSAPYMTAEASQAAENMIAAAAADGVTLTFSSAYRSESYQSQLYNGYVAKYGVEEADSISSRPGYSDHQTGLTADFKSVTNSSANLTEKYANTIEGKWLAKNAYKYGFIQRYPQGKSSITGYSWEPWHYRYVGINYSTQMHTVDPNNVNTTMEEFFGFEGGETYKDNPNDSGMSNAGNGAATIDDAEDEVYAMIYYEMKSYCDLNGFDVSTVISGNSDIYKRFSQYMSYTVGTGSIEDDPNWDNEAAWGSGNNSYRGGYGGQCTWFAWGRMYEIYGFDVFQGGRTGNGNECAGIVYERNKDKFDAPTSTRVCAGAIYSYTVGNHVGVVTAVYSDGSFDIQDGNVRMSVDNVNVFNIPGKYWNNAAAAGTWRKMHCNSISDLNGGNVIFTNPKEGVLNTSTDNDGDSSKTQESESDDTAESAEATQ